MPFHVDSEVGRLHQVILHRPGLELTRLTPQNVDDLLFDDVMWAQRAREEHDAFAEKLQAQGRQGLSLPRPARAGDRPARRAGVPPGGARPPRPGSARRSTRRWTSSSAAGRRTCWPRRSWAASSSPTSTCPKTSSLLLEYLDDDDFLLAPLPNHLFQRDNSAWVYDGLSVNPMSKPARKRETINSRLVWNFHPMFARRPAALLLRQRQREPRPGQLRGRRHPRHRQRRGHGRHGGADQPAGHRVPRPAVLPARHGHQGHRRRAAQDALVHAPRHRDDDDRPRRVQRVPAPARDAPVVHAHPDRHRRRLPGRPRTTSCSRSSPTPSASRRSA